MLVEHCHACHSAKARQVFAGLKLDSAAGVHKGSETGPVISQADPLNSKLLQVLQGRGKQMPPTGKLPDAKITTFAKWVQMGAPWPDEPEEAPDPSAPFDLEARKASHWAWQPVEVTAPPAVNDESWPIGAVDRFLLAKLESESLKPAAAADRHTFIRRAAFDITGLPPTPEEVERFVKDPSADAYETLIDRLLASPRFGERWARHWMDLMRYAESHGSEGDPDTLEAWRYRDYLIRAFNADVPYDQLIREHLAGDLLKTPRVNRELNVNESLIGTAHFRMVEHSFQPVEPWEDRVKWTDNQVDVISKTFMGLTVSCARCHDHKFDAISQTDYYAMFGVIKGARPTQRALDDVGYLLSTADRMAELKAEIKSKLAETWLEKAETLFEEDVTDREALWGSESPLHAWALLRDLDGEEFRQGWERLAAYWSLETASREKFNETRFDWKWDLSKKSDYDKWLRHGVGLGDEPSKPGEFAILPAGDQIVRGVYPSGVYTHLLTEKHNGVLQSPRFTIDSDYISLRLAGGNFPVARLMIENYSVPRGGIYHQRYTAKSDQGDWHTWKTDYWKGFSAYIEYATLQDATNYLPDSIDASKRPRPTPNDDGRSYMGVGQVVFHNGDDTPRDTVTPIEYVLTAGAPSSSDELAALYERLLLAAVEAWREESLNERQAAYLDFFVRNKLLPNSVAALNDVAKLVADYRKLEEETPIPRRAPVIIDEGGPDQTLLVRGDVDNHGDPVPRRFLTALGGREYGEPVTARLDLAEDLTAPSNPLAARVMVNRLWRYLFGRGLVRTVDNFGKLGEKPSHPELLDYLADRFIKEGWSIKMMIRLLATSQAYRMSSEAAPAAMELDPENRLLQHASIRRLEGEAIRDSLLAVSGRLDLTMHGQSIRVFYAYGRGKTKGDKPVGPLDGDGRRSVYQEIRRNAHNPFLEVFDQPKPASTRGQRDETNVPAQSLTMLNSPLVIGQAKVWAEKLVKQDEPAADRISRMFVKAFAREPAANEKDRSETYVAELAAKHGISDNEVLKSEQIWQDFAHALFNLKEFIYIR